MRLMLCVLPFAMLACGPGSPSPDLVMADVGQRPVTYGEFQRFVDSNALASGDDLVLSRMLDALVEQTILLDEAERQGLSISDEQIDLYLAQNEREAGDAIPTPVQRREIRQRLMVLKLQHALIGMLPEPSELELRAHVTKMGWGDARRLRVRTLRLESAEAAATVSEAIESGELTFAEALQLRRADAGQGVPLDLSWETLSPEVQAAVETLEPGQVSAPVEFMGETFIFQLDSWLSGVEIEEELLARARRQLLGNQERDARSLLLQKLRAATTTTIHEERLPFRYRAPSG